MASPGLHHPSSRGRPTPRPLVLPLAAPAPAVPTPEHAALRHRRARRVLSPPARHGAGRPASRRIAIRLNTQYATSAMINTPTSVNRIRISGELPSHQRILVSVGKCPTVYSDPTRKLVTLSCVATIRSPWI